MRFHPIIITAGLLAAAAPPAAAQAGDCSRVLDFVTETVRANLLDSLLRAHHDEIVRTPRLVIDVRDNGGGSDLAACTRARAGR